MSPINADAIAELEEKLSAFLPDSYKYLLTTYGLVHSPNVLTKICDLNSELSAVQDFLSLDDVASLSQLYELSGMPKGYILIASDCKGNMYCFNADECADKQADVSVWFYNYSLCTVEKVSPSFTQWLEQFNEL